MTLHTIQGSHKGEKRCTDPKTQKLSLANCENDDKAFCTENYVLQTIHSIYMVI